MHNTTLRNPIHLVYQDGSVVWTFTGWDQLLHYWPNIRHYRIGPGPSHRREFDRHADWCEICSYSYYDYILRDSVGDCISPDTVRAAYNAEHPYRRKYRYIPGSKRVFRGGYFRSPRTLQERRWATAWDNEEFAPKNGFCRAQRNSHNLPNSWDDIPHRDVDNNNWKRYRKYQWKVKD